MDKFSIRVQPEEMYTPAEYAPFDFADEYEDYDMLPVHGKMSASKPATVNTKMATLKVVEGRRNRFVKQGLLK